MKKVETKFNRYDEKRVQVAQIKCVKDSDEHKELIKAIDLLKKEKGYTGAKEVFVSSVLEAAANLKI